MTNGSEPRTSRALPVAVASLFGLVLLADLVVLAFYGHYRNVLEDGRVEIGFRPKVAGTRAESGVPEGLPVPVGGVLVDDDGTVLAERSGETVVVRARGELVVRFRVPEAGALLELDYRFLDPDDRARCEVAVGRVVNRHGVDVVRRLRLVAIRRPAGTFRHELADHVGWVELRLKLNGAAARGGFEIALPRVARG